MKQSSNLDDRVAQVLAWVRENTRVYETPSTVTLFNFEFDHSDYSGTFCVLLDVDHYVEDYSFFAESDGWPRWCPPMFHSPLGAPASYPAVRLTPETERAIDRALRSVLPRLRALGLDPETGEEITNITHNVLDRVVDHHAYRDAVRKITASGFYVTETVEV